MMKRDIDIMKAGEMKYDSFFDPPPKQKSKQKTREDEEEESIRQHHPVFADEEYDETDELTPFQQQQKKLQEKIKKLETTIVQPKSWEMSGEVKSKQRPYNSLLEIDLDFEHASKVNNFIFIMYFFSPY